MLQLDRILYVFQQEAAGRYGGETHTKLRLIQYDRFFNGRIRPGETVLDIGCGVGALAHAMALEGAQVTGIDFHAGRLNRAKTQYDHPNVTFLYGDVLTYQFEEPFDVVVMSNVLEHLPGRVDFLTRVTESVRPQRWLIRVPLYERDWRVPLKDELGVEYRLDPTHTIEYTQENFAAETDAAGLTISHMEIRWGEIWAELIPSRIE